MRTTLYRVVAAIVMVAIVLLVGGAAATAQKVAPACPGENPSLLIKNQTDCDIQAMIITDPAESYINEFIPAGQAIWITPAPGIVGVHDSGGFPNIFRQDPVNPKVYWVRNIRVFPDDCCVDVKYEPAICTITFLPCAP